MKTDNLIIPTVVGIMLAGGFILAQTAPSPSPTTPARPLVTPTAPGGPVPGSGPQPAPVQPNQPINPNQKNVLVPNPNPPPGFGEQVTNSQNLSGQNLMGQNIITQNLRQQNLTTQNFSGQIFSQPFTNGMNGNGVGGNGPLTNDFRRFPRVPLETNLPP